jgi:hypothetical protein
MSLKDKYGAVLKLAEDLKVKGSGANKDQLKDPNLIKPGQKLVLPNP